MTRDATSLTGSVTFAADRRHRSGRCVRITSPLVDTTELQAFSQEMRLASGGDGPFDWLAGAFYQDVGRRYGQGLPTPGYDAITTGIVNTTGADAPPPDNPFFSRLSYDFKQIALFGEGTYHFNEQWALTGGVRYYDFKEDRAAHVRRRLRRAAG